MKRALSTLAMGGVVALAGCGERPQALDHAAAARHDTKASQGAQNAFVAAGWTPGDDSSWQTQLRTRAQQGQNEYNRSAAEPAAK